MPSVSILDRKYCEICDAAARLPLFLFLRVRSGPLLFFLESITYELHNLQFLCFEILTNCRGYGGGERTTHAGNAPPTVVFGGNGVAEGADGIPGARTGWRRR